jgi:hypothetical protein
MIRSIVSTIGVIILVVAVYKIFGGDVGLAITTAANFVIDIADAGSDVVLEAWNKLGA